MGPQQLAPLEPWLFCLPLKPVLRSLETDFRLGYLDDNSLGASLEYIPGNNC